MRRRTKAPASIDKEKKEGRGAKDYGEFRSAGSIPTSGEEFTDLPVFRIIRHRIMEELHWYAYKIYHNRMRFVRERAEQAGWECFVPMRRRLRSADYNLSDEEATVCEPVISSLLFIRSDDAYMTSLRRDPDGRAGVYCLPGTNEPAVIPDKEMGFFIFALTRDCEVVEAVSLDF